MAGNKTWEPKLTGIKKTNHLWPSIKFDCEIPQRNDFVTVLKWKQEGKNSQ
jgi:hypothetical protein